MATIASLNVSIKAQTKQFVTAINKAAWKIDVFITKTSRLAKEIATSSATIVSSISAITAVVVKMNAKSLDSLAKFSDRIGIAAEQLQSLEFAAGRTGVSMEQFRMGLQRMTRRIAEAGQGTGEAVKALDELSLSAKFLAQLAPDEQFRVLADAMEEVEVQGERVRLAMKLFDSEGVALVNTMKGGSEALDEVSKKAKELGFILTRTNLKSIEIMNNSMGELSMSLSVFGKVLTSQLSPSLTVISRKMTEFIVGMKTADLASKFVEGMIASFRVLLNVVKTLERGLRFQFARLLEGIGVITKAMGFLAKSVAMDWKLLMLPKGAKEAIDGFNKMITESGKELQNLGRIMKEDVWEDVDRDVRIEGSKSGKNFTQSFMDEFKKLREAIVKEAEKSSQESAKKLEEAFNKVSKKDLFKLARAEKNIEKIKQAFKKDIDAMFDFVEGPLKKIEETDKKLKKKKEKKEKEERVGFFKEIDLEKVSPTALAKAGEKVQFQQLQVLEKIAVNTKNAGPQVALIGA